MAEDIEKALPDPPLPPGSYRSRSRTRKRASSRCSKRSVSRTRRSNKKQSEDINNCNPREETNISSPVPPKPIRASPSYHDYQKMKDVTKEPHKRLFHRKESDYSKTLPRKPNNSSHTNNQFDGDDLPENFQSYKYTMPIHLSRRSTTAPSSQQKEGIRKKNGNDAMNSWVLKTKRALSAGGNSLSNLDSSGNCKEKGRRSKLREKVTTGSDGLDKCSEKAGALPSISRYSSTPMSKNSRSNKAATLMNNNSMRLDKVKAVVDTGRDCRHIYYLKSSTKQLGDLNSIASKKSSKHSLDKSKRKQTGKKPSSVRALAKAHRRKVERKKTKKRSMLNRLQSKSLKHRSNENTNHQENNAAKEGLYEADAKNCKTIASKIDSMRPPGLDFSKLSVNVSGSTVNQIEVPPEEEDVLEKTYEFTSTGSFNIQGFEIQETGITKVPEYGSVVPENLKTNLVHICRLGKGASGVVNEMLHVPTLRVVAVKSIPCFEQEKRHQMIQEIRALYSNIVPIQYGIGPPCPYIVAFYDAFISPKQGHISIVEEYMDGGSLQDVVDSGGCDSEIVLANIAYSVLEGLSFLHGRNQIHRDIKPSNLLINNQGEVKISDFGITRDVSDQKAQVNTFVGTMTYMSPERITGKEYSFTSDIWSFGMSLLAVSLGQYPISTGAGYWEILHALREKPSPNAPRDQFSSNFCDFISLCLIKDPHQRPTAQALLKHDFIVEFSKHVKNSDQVEKKINENYDAGKLESRIADLEEICLKLNQFMIAQYIANRTIRNESTISNSQVSARNQNHTKKQYETGMGHCTCLDKGKKCAYCNTVKWGNSSTSAKSTISSEEAGHTPGLIIPRYTDEQYQTLAFQLALPLNIVKKTFKHHIRKTGEWFRRQKLYNTNN